MKSYFFGCRPGSGAGHCLFREGQRHVDYHPEFSFPYTKLDTGFCPVDRSQPQGLAKVTHIEGWTVLSFWDRTGDKRFNGNSSFVVQGEHDFESMKEFAAERFPVDWARITAAGELVDAGSRT